MPAPDIQYVLDGSLECGHIGGDTHFYLLEMEPRVTELVDDYRDPVRYDTHWEHLSKMGMFFEGVYVDWRDRHRAESKVPSYAGLTTLGRTFTETVRTYASRMEEKGFKSLSREAWADLDHTYQATAVNGQIRRTLHRASSDFLGWTGSDIRGLQNVIDGRRAENGAAYDAAVARIMANMNQQIAAFEVGFQDHIRTNNYVTGNVNGGLVVPHRNQDKVRRELQKNLDQKRRSIKRSVKFMSKLVGDNQTRMYIGGHEIRIEGKHAIYEMKKVSSLTNAHGGYRALSVYDKKNPQLLLANFCIYTERVPLLDHIAGLIMRIQAGEEEDILRIGNAHVKDDSAYDLPWLAPFLPKLSPPVWNNGEEPLQLDRLFGNRYLTPEQKITRDIEVARLRKVVAKHLIDNVFGEYLPLLRKAEVEFHLQEPRNRGLLQLAEPVVEARIPVQFLEFAVDVIDQQNIA